MPRVKRLFKPIHQRSDKKGNMIIVTEEPVYGNRKVYIHLAGEDKPRLIGEIDRRNKILFVRRDKSKHYHYKMNAYGFNWVVINETKNFNQVLLLLKDGSMKQYFMIPVDFIKSNGMVKNFSSSGFELQVFLRAEYLDRFSTKTRFNQSALLQTNEHEIHH
jgi:hypothetical protein